jgi:hypothetical protein
MWLPFVWTLFAVCAVAGFVTIAAYWLDVQDRPDLTRGSRIAWSAAIVVFALSIPIYAFTGGPGWPPFLRAASLLPAFAMLLFAGFAFDLFG